MQANDDDERDAFKFYDRMQSKRVKKFIHALPDICIKKIK